MVKPRTLGRELPGSSLSRVAIRYKKKKKNIVYADHVTTGHMTVMLRTLAGITESAECRLVNETREYKKTTDMYTFYKKTHTFYKT